MAPDHLFLVWLCVSGADLRTRTRDLLFELLKNGRDGLPITTVLAMLGHALTSTTLNNYAHVLLGADRLTADAMERLLG